MSDNTASSHPSSSIDVSVLTFFYRKCLFSVLDKLVGPKTLVIDPQLAGPLGLITEISALKAKGVDRMFYLEEGPLTQAQRHVVYLCSDNSTLMRIIADQVKQMDSSRFTHTLLMAPRISTLCTSLLQDLGVYGQLEIEAFPFDLLPLERDVLSLERPNTYCSIFHDGDYTLVYDMAKALMTLQRAFGQFPRIVGKGDAAERLSQLLVRMKREVPTTTTRSGGAQSLPEGAIDSLIILDRQVDMVTPMCTQLTYEGLVDEFIGIRNAHVEVDQNMVNPPPNALPSPSTALTKVQAPAKKKKIHLSSLDPLYHEIRDRNFATIGPVLNRVAKRINADYESRHSAMQGSVNQMKNFVGKLGNLQAESQSLRLHTGLTEQIMQTTMTDEFNRALEVQQNTIAGIDLGSQEGGIRDLINAEASFKLVLRLLCLYSLVLGGLKQKVLEDFQRELLQTYGYSFLPLLVALNTLGILTKSTSSSTKSTFVYCRKPLRLVIDDVDESKPDDIAYVYSGYAPLSIRLVQGCLGRNGSFLGWKSIEDTVKNIPGKKVDVSQKHEADTKPASSHSALVNQDSGPITVVCFLGGCTYTEIAALRWVSQQARGGRQILIVTTEIITGNSLLASLTPKGLTL